MKNFSELGITPTMPVLQGEKVKIERVLNKPIVVHSYQIKDSKYDRGNGKCLHIQIELDKQKRVLFTGSGVLMETLEKIPKDEFPFNTTIVKDNDRFQFT